MKNKFQSNKFYGLVFIVLFLVTFFIFLNGVKIFKLSEKLFIKKIVYSSSLDDDLKKEIDSVFPVDSEIEKKINKMDWKTYKEENGLFKIELPKKIIILNKEKENLETLRYNLSWQMTEESKESENYFEEFRVSVKENNGAGEIGKDFCEKTNKCIKYSNTFFCYCNNNTMGFLNGYNDSGRIHSIKIYHKEIISKMIVELGANVNADYYNEALLIFKKIALSLQTNKKEILKIQKIREEYKRIEKEAWDEKMKSDNLGPADRMHWGAKPVIYLYPEKKKEVKVKLEYEGKIIVDFPEYDYSINGWNVIAYPDGRIINKADNLEYSYLFWEGIFNENIGENITEGFVVPGNKSREFLREKLLILGLTPKEYNEFIVYWYPLMQKNKYNLVHFAGEEYTNAAKLTITPTPDSILRVFMIFKPLEKEIEIAPQKLETFERKGFSVVEWGGMEIK